MIQFSASSTPHFHPAGGETFRINVEPALENRKNPHQTGLFLIPPDYAQVNTDYPHSAYRESREMHSLCRPVARTQFSNSYRFEPIAARASLASLWARSAQAASSQGAAAAA